MPQNNNYLVTATIQIKVIKEIGQVGTPYQPNKANKILAKHFFLNTSITTVTNLHAQTCIVLLHSYINIQWKCTTNISQQKQTNRVQVRLQLRLAVVWSSRAVEHPPMRKLHKTQQKFFTNANQHNALFGSSIISKNSPVFVRL